LKEEQYLFVNALFVENMFRKNNKCPHWVSDLPTSTETPDKYDEC
jgi:hypothetical protein